MLVPWRAGTIIFDVPYHQKFNNLFNYFFFKLLVSLHTYIVVNISKQKKRSHQHIFGCIFVAYFILGTWLLPQPINTDQGKAQDVTHAAIHNNFIYIGKFSTENYVFWVKSRVKKPPVSRDIRWFLKKIFLTP